MESHWTGNRLIGPSRRRQGGLTLIGFLLVAAFVGFIGLAVIKIVPLYMQKMRIDTVLSDIKDELSTGGNTPASIKNSLDDHFYIEALKDLTADEYKIERSTNGFTVTINREARAPFFADLYFVVVIDEQVEISR